MAGVLCHLRALPEGYIFVSRRLYVLFNYLQIQEQLQETKSVGYIWTDYKTRNEVLNYKLLQS